MSVAARKGPRESSLFLTSFEKGFKILEAFEPTRRQMSLSQLADATALDKSGVQRFTHTLHALGYLHRDPATKRYSLGPKLLQLASTYLRSDELIGRASPILADCNARCGESMNLARLDGLDVTYLVRTPSKHVKGVDIMLGSRLPAYCTAMGRAILSAMAREEARTIVAASSRVPRTPKTITEPQAIELALVEARSQGFAIDEEQTYLGDLSVAAPIVDASGRVLGAVGVAAPTIRWTVETARGRLAPLVVGIADALSRPSISRSAMRGIEELARSVNSARAPFPN